MTISERGIELIKRFEGLQLKAYKCPAGVMSIGYGHTKDVSPTDEITEEKATELLKLDVKHADRVVSFYTKNLTQNQFDALVSFVFNVGSGNFKSSTLLKKINADPKDPTIRTEFEKWVKSSGEVLPGLIARRRAESELYFMPFDHHADN